MKVRSIAFRSRGNRLVALLWVLLMACAGNPHLRSKDEWARAREVAERYLRDKYGTAWKITEERQAVPFMFDIDVVDAASVLVHDNAVFTQRGMAGFDRYLRGSRCVEQRLPSVEDMTVLLHFFDVYPPDSHPQGYFLLSTPQPAWRPHLEYLDGGRATLTLIYRIWDDDNTDDHGESSDTEGYLRAWTLTMDPGQMPVWRSETRVWNDEKERWVVHHTN
ncbi:MAG TPA: hypothetical protein VIV40_37820 [Kofleriaceae bacterium]